MTTVGVKGVIQASSFELNRMFIFHGQTQFISTTDDVPHVMVSNAFQMLQQTRPPYSQTFLSRLPINSFVNTTRNTVQLM